MRKWEDIIKDKMEEVGDNLPESVFEEFRDRRNGTAPVPVGKRFPLAWAIAPAVAAGLAAVLLLRQPSLPENAVQIVPQPTPPVAEVENAAEVSEPSESVQLIAQTVVKKAIQRPSAQPQEEDEEEGIEEAKEAEEVVSGDQDLAGKVEKEDYTPTYNPETSASKTVKVKVAPVTGVIAGGGLIAALTSPIVGAWRNNNDSNPIHNTPDLSNVSVPGPSYQNIPEKPVDVLTGEARHSFPVKVGMSMRIPVAKRLDVTTGVDYSMYSSKFTYSLSGEKTQIARYVGVPVRLDWTFASRRWFEAYIGGGMEGDWCVGATLAGIKIKKDGPTLSLIGAGGMQLNVTRQLGLYVEPQLSWSMPSRARVLDTYRSGNPIAFLTTGGIRFSFGRYF